MIGADVHSTGLDVSTQGRDVTVLFGDGAGAMVLGRATPDLPLYTFQNRTTKAIRKLNATSRVPRPDAGEETDAVEARDVASRRVGLLIYGEVHTLRWRRRSATRGPISRSTSATGV